MQMESALLTSKMVRALGVTIGCGTGIGDFVREYHDNGIKSKSMEIAVYPYSYQDGAFSAPGDSGHVSLACSLGFWHDQHYGRNLLNTYFWVEEQIKKVFPNSYLYAIKE